MKLTRKDWEDIVERDRENELERIYWEIVTEIEHGDYGDRD